MNHDVRLEGLNIDMGLANVTWLVVANLARVVGLVANMNWIRKLMNHDDVRLLRDLAKSVYRIRGYACC